MPKTEKSTTTNLEKRVTEIYRCIVKGLDRSEILQYVAKLQDDYAKNTNPDKKLDSWNVEVRMIDDYISRARELFKENAAKVREVELGKQMARLEFVFQQCIRVQDYSKAIAALREYNLLLGLHEPVKIKEITWRDQALADIKAGNITYEALADAFDDDLATELFRTAGVPVQTK